MTIISKHLKFGSASKLDGTETPMLLNHFRAITRIGVSSNDGFKVTPVIMADSQFEPLHVELASMSALINAVSHDEHMSQTFNATSGPLKNKEWVHSQHNYVLPFTYTFHPCRCQCLLVQNSPFQWQCIRDTEYTTSEIILNRPFDFNSHMVNWNLVSSMFLSVICRWHLVTTCHTYLGQRGHVAWHLIRIAMHSLNCPCLNWWLIRSIDWHDAARATKMH